MMDSKKAALPIIFLTFFACMPCLAQKKRLPGDIATALNSVKPAQVKDDIKYLADDKLAGRFPGTPGYTDAANYVIARLKLFKVKPAGENGSWLQTVRLRQAIVHGQLLNVDLRDGHPADTLSQNSYAIYPNPAITDVSLTSTVVFAGYGISEPSFDYDDYAGIDVKDKIVLVIRGAPDKFPSSLAAHVSSSSTILKTAADHGASGVIIANSDSLHNLLPDIKKGVYSVLGQQGNVALSRTYYSTQITLFGVVKYELFTRFLNAAGKKADSVEVRLKNGVSQSVKLNVEINASYASDYHDITGYNIVGKIEGSDTKLKNEFVVHSAHLDHLGIGKPVQGDSIYNGAHDNASGVASLLGIARIYSHIKIKPKRSVILAFVTGEEMGLLGSGYFALHPTVPIKSIVANINTDMPTIIAPLLSITALGAEHSSLSKQVDQAAAYLGIQVEPDPEPKQARFTRSDQYSFVLAGIPALHIKYGNKTADGKNNLNQQVAIWRAKYYHQPQDDINGIFDFNAGVKYARLNFLIGYLVAQDWVRPVWNAGDVFGQQE